MALQASTRTCPGPGPFAFEVLTQAGVLASTGRNASARAARQLGAHGSGQRPTKQHTTQEARCNQPIGTGVCGNVPCWLALALRHPPQAAQKKKIFSKKSAEREIRTRNVTIRRRKPSPLGCSDLSRHMCFNVYRRNRHLMRSIALSCALPEPHADASHATLRPRWLHTPRTSPAPIPALHRRTAPPPHCRVRRIPQPTIGHQHCPWSCRRRIFFGIWAAASAPAA